MLLLRHLGRVRLPARSAWASALIVIGALAGLPAVAQTPSTQAATVSVYVPVAARPNSGVIPAGASTVNFAYTGAAQTYTVPPGVTQLRLVARGAQGGDVTENPGEEGGLGATMQGDVSVVPGSVLTVVVGGKGSAEQYTSGGGGASGVAFGSTPLIVAGGGGGVDFQDLNYAARHAVTTQSGQPGNPSSGGNGAGGTAGGDGGDSIYSGNNISRGGRGFLSGVGGSLGQNGTSPNTVTTAGSFGLGGGGGSVGSGWCNCGAGGGGYSGGGAGSINTSGGGGGSYNSGSNQINTAGDNAGNGIVSITPLTPTTDLAITKTDASAIEIPGTSVTYTVVASNAGPTAVVGASITDTLPAALTGATWTCVGAGSGTCTASGSGNIADSVQLPVGGSVTYTITATIASGATGTLSNTGTIAPPAGVSDTNPANDSATDSDTLIPDADLALALTDAPDPVIAGSNITYTATITNAGPSDAQGVSLDLPMPAGTTFVSAAPVGGSCTTPAVGANGLITCTWAGSTGIGAGNARSASILIGVPAATANGSVLSVTGTAASSVADATPGNNDVTVTTTVQSDADLAVTLTDSPDPVIAGSGQITYLATVSNNGPAPAQDVALSLPTATGTTFVSATPSAGGSCATTPAVGASGPLNCTWTGATNNAATRTLTVIVGVPAATAGGSVFSVSATATSSTPDPTPGNNSVGTTTTVDAEAELSATLTDTPDPVLAGGNLTYTVVLSNAGASDAQNAQISLPLPSGTSLVSATAAGGSCSGTTTVVCVWSGATAPGATRSATIVALVAAATSGGSTLTATATASSSTTDPTPGNNSATTTTQVAAQADLTAGLSDAPDPVDAGAQLTYTATVTNSGVSDAQNAQISVLLPADTSLVSATGAGAVCTGTTTVVCVWSGATAPGATRTATISVLVGAAVANGAILTATNTVSSATTDPTPGNDSASTTTTVISAANLALTLTASSMAVPLNAPVDFTAVSSNLGPASAQNLSISIVLSPDFRFAGAVPGAGGVCTTPQVGLTGTITCTYAGATAANASRTLVVTASAAVNGVSTISASTTSATSDPVSTNNNANVSISAGVPSAPIPANSPQALILLALLLGGLGLALVRRLA